MLGSILVTTTVSKVEKTLGGFGVPKGTADSIAHAISSASTGAGGGGFGHASHAMVRAVQVDFAQSVKVVVTGMAAAMALAFLIAFLRMPRGRPGEAAADEPAAAGTAAAPVA